MLEGTMCQKRVPGPAYFWKVGQLRWVQEPFIEFVDRKRQTLCGITYRADHQGAIAGPPEHMRHSHCKSYIRGAEQMRAGSSRLTLEITEVVVGERVNIYDLDHDHIREGWNVALRWGVNAATYLNPPIAMGALIRFNVIRENVARVISAREAA